ncbi:hypothetical protein [Streptomyces ficellus]|uniref:hypothetical protein n=1 Tax=Streptomyces ficellus TaxID=1977088 RepID=UPI00142EBEB2|nr:hypothetical protein [Streptomyces ficellus]
MRLKLPLQGSIDRAVPYRPFFIKSPYKEDGVIKWRQHEIGGQNRHDPGDPGPCVDPEQCDDSVAGVSEGEAL